MTSSLRGLALCTALLVSLGLGWVLGLGAPGSAPSPQLWARRPDSVRSIRWLRQGEARQGEVRQGEARQVREARMTAQRDGAGWTATPAGGRALPAKARVVEDLLDVLAAARWHRRDAAARAGTLTEHVILSGGRGELSIGLGAALGEQRWLVIDDELEGGGEARALLVDGWVARVLEQAPDELLDLALLPDAARAPTVEIHRSGAAPWRSEALVLQGAARISPSRARLDEALGRALRDQLAALQLVPDAASGAEGAAEGAGGRASEGAGEGAAEGAGGRAGDDAAPRWSIRVAGGPRGEATVAELGALSDREALGGRGACAGGARVRSSRLGSGCLPEAALRPLAELIDRAASAAGVEARPLAASAPDIVEWTLATASGAPDRLRLARQGASGWSGERNGAAFSVEPAAAERLLAVLCSPWSIAEPALRPASPRALSLTARHRDGTTLSLSLWPSSSAASSVIALRDGEPVSLTSPVPLSLAPSALAASLASLSLWQLEPTSVVRVALGGQTLQRGAVIGEWLDARHRPIAAARAAALEELLSQLASLRALSRTSAARLAPAPRYRLTLWLDDAPARAPAQAASAPHTLELSLERGECAGRADGEGGVFSPELCAQLAALVP